MNKENDWTSDTERQRAIHQLKRDLVLGCHLLAMDGQGSGIAGHFTARLPGENTFWTYQWHQAFEEVTYDDIIEADFSLETVTGQGRVNPTLHIHTTIYEARQDVCCIVHTHGENAVAIGVTGNTIEPVWQPGAIFYDNCVLFDEFDGVVLDRDEGERIAGALGDKSAVLLRNHGMLIASESVRMGCISALTLESVAGMQLKAMAAGEMHPMPREAALQAKRFLTSEDVTNGRWAYLARKVMRARPDLEIPE
ncbi:class II aldolase/adducin family protein [Aquicoccus sp. G2-2]|jgi:L-fuculose-phosphate aldolase|uniref:class II aldolase/adducin family protein n=1 Tax=Aquicoccus sp. G2-2 TaxID=3092120 RepID=UPI002AE03707|nr:class II aldolase/adducin family protein [Aquicoccus sp. G2-2]MEA1114793.1 class II aldolase/adducin family protein [Aquicoccus sp. G2-2]